MQLTLHHINTTTCPECGAKAQAFRKYGLHTSGSWNETVEFACGLTLHFIPNFNSIHTEGRCTRSEAAKRMAERRMQATRGLYDFVNAIDVDNDTKRVWCWNYLML